jgi:hypothetical protein
MGTCEHVHGICASRYSQIKNVATAAAATPLRLLPCMLLHALFPILVVDLALLSIRQHLVRCMGVRIHMRITSRHADIRMQIHRAAHELIHHACIVVCHILPCPSLPLTSANFFSAAFFCSSVPVTLSCK